MTIAYWCVLAAALLPYFIVIAAKSGPGLDNRAPRLHLAQTSGWRQRAHWAHQNAFEAFPPFAAAVLIAEQLRAPQHAIDLLALGFIAMRILHAVFYVMDKAALRSLVWGLGFLCVLGLFFISA